MNVFITGDSSGIGEALATEYAIRYNNSDTFIELASSRSEHLLKLRT